MYKTKNQKNMGRTEDGVVGGPSGAERRGNNFDNLTDFHLKGQHLALTVLCVPYLLDSGGEHETEFQP